MPAWIRRAYRVLLRCYPKAFRDEYEVDMRRSFERMWGDSAREGPPALARLSLSVFVDTMTTALREHGSIVSQDLRVSGRALRKFPAFTAGIVGTLTLGIGATTAILSVVYAILLRPMPFPEPEQLVELVATKPLEGIASFSTSGPDFTSWRERTRAFVGMAAMTDRDVNLSDDAEPERVRGAAVTGTFWSVLRVQPIAGRTFDEADDLRGNRIVVLSDGLHRRRYGGDPGLLGRAVELNGVAHTVIGIVPGDMGFTQDVDVWMPFVADQQNRGDRQIGVVARLGAGVELGAASAELEGIAAALAREFPATNLGYSARARPLLDLAVSPALERALHVLLAAVVLLLVIACANVAHLLLTRAADRRHELAVRRALGAGTARLTRQLATEALVLAALGAIGGIALAAALVRVAQPTLAALLPRARHIALDLPVLGMALLTTVATAFIFGLLPILRVSGADVSSSLHAAGRVQSDRSLVSLRRTFVVGQFALASVLVVGAALLAQSLARMMRVDPGFRTDHLLMTGITTPTGVSGQDGRIAFFRRIVDEVRAVPGVTSAGLGWNLPLRPGAGGPGMEVAATPESVLSAGRAHWRIATPGYFSTIGIPLLRGRLFLDGEREIPNGFRAVIVSESLAARLWPNHEDPIGRQVWLGNGHVRTVVGIVGDVHQRSLAEGITPTMYMPTAWVFPATNVLLVRTAGPPADMAGAIRRTVRGIDPRQTLFDLQTMDEYVSATVAQQRLNATILGAFALLALLLGAVGVAGVVAHSVSARRPELAVRMALGGRSSRIVRDVAATGVRLCAYGLALGLGVAIVVARAAASLLFGVQPGDPTTFVFIGLVLLAVAMIACVVPALRVTRIDPAVALRGQ
jgi:putative ABC transport system permease protein